MSTLYERLAHLCAQKGVKGGKMCAELNLSKSLMTDLKMGRKKSVSAQTAHKLASYFGVTVGYLLGEETEKAPAEDDKRNEEGVNIIKIAGRDGSYRERRLTDKQVAAFTLLLDQMQDVPEDL